MERLNTHPGNSSAAPASMDKLIHPRAPLSNYSRVLIEKRRRRKGQRLKRRTVKKAYAASSIKRR